MNETKIETSVIETSAIETPSRREAFKRVGLLAGGAVLGGTLLNLGRARAADDGAMMTGDMSGAPATMAPGSMMDEKMMQRNAMMKGTLADDNLPPMLLDKTSKNDESDVEILNYALFLEFLEADYYTRVVQAQSTRPYLRGGALNAAQTLARDETTHVQTIIDAITKLGGQPRPKPQFQFPNDAFISQIAFLNLSAQLEATGVGAYLNEAPGVGRNDVLQFAAAIYGTEARHVGLIRFLLGDIFSPDEIEHPFSRETVLQRVDPFVIK